MPGNRMLYMHGRGIYFIIINAKKKSFATLQQQPLGGYLR